MAEIMAIETQCLGKVQACKIKKVKGVNIKTNFKTLTEERDWLFNRYYALQCIYDRKYKS